MLNKDDKDEKGKFARNFGPYLGLGLQLAVTVGVMVFIGYWLDEKFDTSPILIIAFSFLGIFAALYNFIKTVTKSGK